METNLREALRLASLGWKVFALGPTGYPYPTCKPCKTMHVCASDYEACTCPMCHGCYAATSDLSVIEQMWHHLPQSLIGVRTGRASGLFVLDFDKHAAEKDGEQGLRQLREELVRTVAADTGGGGLHLYYQHPGDLDIPNDNRGKLALGVDIKGEGGYVVAAPSAKRGKQAYAWKPGLEPWNRGLASLSSETLLKITKDTSRPVSLGLGEGEARSKDPETVSAAFSEALEALRGTTEGGRNEALYRASCRGGEAVACGVQEEAVAIALLEDAALQAGLVVRETRQTIRSGLLRGAHDFKEDSE